MEDLERIASVTPIRTNQIFAHLLEQERPAERLLGPIEAAMREKLNKLVGSQYPDAFDWSVYDEIASRYGDEQPRGGVVFQTTFKLVNHHSSCSKCHYAFEIDSYGRGCIHDCVYCYAKEMLIGRGFWNRPMPFPVDLSEVRKIMYTVFETDKPSKWRSIMMRRTPVRIGSMSDSFMWMDKKYKVTEELIKILNFYKYPHIIFTRSDLAAHDSYTKLYDPNLVSIQFSISGNDEKITKQIEPGAPSYKRRLVALRRLNEAGIWTTARINPFFPTHPDGFFTDNDGMAKRFSGKQVPTFDLFKWDMLDDLQEANVPSVLVGVVRLSNAAISGMTKSTGIDIRSFFNPEINSGHNDKRFSDSEVAYYYNRFAKECHDRQMRFNTCYIGNGAKDYYKYQNLWANKKDCCDAIGNVSDFRNTSQAIPWEVREKHTQDKTAAKKTRTVDSELAAQFSAKPQGADIVSFNGLGQIE